MPEETEITLDPKMLKAIFERVVETQCVPRMKHVAAACNAGLPEHPKMEAPDNYMVSTEGDQPLASKLMATVITATGEAMRDNAKNNTLVKNFYLAGGDL